MNKVDVVIKNGKLATTGGIFEVGVAIDNGKVVAIAKDPNLPEAERVIDAKGNVIMPGVVDAHVHAFQHDDYAGVSKAAAAGGVTTMTDHPIMGPGGTTTTIKAFEEKKNMCKQTSLIDFAILGGATADNLDELQKLANIGVVGFKIGMYDIVKPIFPRVNDAILLEAFKRVAKTEAFVGPHAENDEIIDALTPRLQKEGRKDILAWGEARPVIAELEAISRAILFAKEAGNKLHIFHMSISGGAELVHRAKAEGLPVTAETCPHYLLLSEDCMRDLKSYAKISPPLRSKKEVEKLWVALQGNKVDSIASDHAEWPKEVKDKGENDIWAAPGGAPGIQSMFPLMLSEGVNKGRITLEKLIGLMCENPAKIQGIYPRKGTIQIGSDGDINIVDLKKEDTIKAEKLYCRVGWTIYDGWKIKGAPILTLVRGNVVAEDGVVTGKPGHAEFVPRL